MLLCDYCQEPIDPNSSPVQIGGTAPPSPSANPAPPAVIRFDLHNECLTPWSTNARTLRGKRGNNTTPKGA